MFNRAHTSKCCIDYQKSELLKCEGCRNVAQVMPMLGLCQTCATGEASPPMEVWRMHTLTCKRLKKEAPNV